MANRMNWDNVYTNEQENELIDRTIEAMRVLVNSLARSDIKKDTFLPLCPDGSTGRYVLTNIGVQWEADSGRGNITGTIFTEEKWPKIIKEGKLTPGKIMNILLHVQAPLCVDLSD